MKRTTQFTAFLCGLLLAALWANAEEGGPSESQIKAAYLYNFAKFVEWPNEPGPLNLCSIGEDRFGRDFDLIEGKTAAGRTLSVRRIQTSQELRKCRMVFVASSESGGLDALLAAAQTYQVLTVGDTAGYAERGVTINFYAEQNKIRFEINKDAADRSGLRISSKLFGLARVIHDLPKRKGG